MKKAKFYYVYDDSVQRKVAHVKIGNKLVSLSTGRETIIEKRMNLNHTNGNSKKG